LTPKLYTPAPWPVLIDSLTLELVLDLVFPLVLRLRLGEGQAPCTPEDNMALPSRAEMGTKLGWVINWWLVG
jgi:hypothetical protein